MCGGESSARLGRCGSDGPGEDGFIVIAVSVVASWRDILVACSISVGDPRSLRRAGFVGVVAISICNSSDALYKVSIPSGIITTSAVPTRSPVPRVDTRCNCWWERENDSGREPARKDLSHVNSCGRGIEGLDVRNGHETAQTEQGEQTVPHGCDGLSVSKIFLLRLFGRHMPPFWRGYADVGSHVAPTMIGRSAVS